MAADAAHRLTERLAAIADALRARADALALIALGSAAHDLERVDVWSDLDFLVVVAAGGKARILERLDWLVAARPIVWRFRHTADGCRALMDDDLFCEFSVYEAQELAGVAFAPGRVVWAREGVDAAIATPQRTLPRPTTDETWIVGEALSCLLTGLARWRRGERLAALRLVQGDALDRLIELDALRSHPVAGDPFDATRRLEDRHPALADELAALAPGYAHTPQAALALLDALARRGARLPEPVVRRVRALAAPG